MFINKTYLTTGKNTIIRWLQNASPVLMNKDSIRCEIMERLGTNIPIQIIPKTIYHKEHKHLITKALTIECAQVNADELKECIFNRFMETQEKYQYGITAHMQIIPMKNAGESNDDVIKKSDDYTKCVLKTCYKNSNL